MSPELLLHGDPEPPATGSRALLISPEFPPGPAAGALRWQELTRLLAEAGWGFDVITLDPSARRSPDWSRLGRLPQGTRVFGVPRTASWLETLVMGAWRWLRSLRSRRPDAGSGSSPSAAPGRMVRPPLLRGGVDVWLEDLRDRRWMRASSALGSGLAREGRHAFVVSCGPPHVAHEVAQRVARSAGLPLIADLRDPWAILEPSNARFVHPLWVWWARRRERRLVAEASLIAMNTDRAAEAMRARYPEASSRVVAIRNGCDEERVPTGSADGCFRVVYAGTVYLDRNPVALFDALADLVAREGLGPEDLRLVFVGTSDAEALRDWADRAGLAAHLDVEPPRPRAELFELLATATVLVSLPQSLHMAIPSKIYEYMAFEAWLLALARAESATAELLADSAARVVDPEDGDGLRACLDDLYARHRRGERPPVLARDARFGRRAQAAKLLERLAGLGLSSSDGPAGCPGGRGGD